MSQQEGKPRVKYAEFAAQQLKAHKEGTIGWLIERYVTEMATSPDMKPLGPSHAYVLRAIGRKEIGQRIAADLSKADIIAYCRMRRQQFVVRSTRLVNPATINQEISYLGVVLKYAASAWEEYEKLPLGVFKAARPFLLKHNLIGKSAPRKRRPTDEEIGALLDFFAKQKLHSNTKIDMAQVIAFALATTRRLGEICRLEYGDIDWQKRTYWIRDVKHPTKKKGNDKEFPLFEEETEIIKRQPRLTDDPHERVFPYNSKSASQSYANAKKDLGIVGLRFHDNRREAITRWLKKLPPHKVRQISGHETTVILERVYAAPKAEDLHAEVDAMRQAA
jgi:integrase